MKRAQQRPAHPFAALKRSWSRAASMIVKPVVDERADPLAPIVALAAFVPELSTSDYEKSARCADLPNYFDRCRSPADFLCFAIDHLMCSPALLLVASMRFHEKAISEFPNCVKIDICIFKYGRRGGVKSGVRLVRNRGPVLVEFSEADTRCAGRVA
ncbi:hypothetical protein LFL97_29020 [Burkholderia sp. JSH-S8]|nr:hypothetical protein LFL97_29020 [Burkholderia sp. JSH-S8]